MNDAREIPGIIDRVKDILIRFPVTRNSDKALVWRYWKEYDKIVYGEGHTSYIIWDNFRDATGHESITRAARKIRESDDTLKANPSVEEAKRRIEKVLGITMKGMK